MAHREAIAREPPARDPPRGETAWRQKKKKDLTPENKKKKKKNKTENILCAIIALMKELDKSGLEFVKMDA